MKATPTLHSTQLLKCNRWPKSLNHTKPLPNTSNSTHPACKALLKSMSYAIITLACHLRKKAVNKTNPSKGTKLQQPQQHNQVNQHQPYDKNPNQCTRGGDSPHAQGFNCQAKKYQCKHCTEIGHFSKMCFTKMHTHSHSNIIEVSQSMHIKLLYLNILISSIKTHTNVIMMMSLW